MSTLAKVEVGLKAQEKQLNAERKRLNEAYQFALKFKQHYPSMKGVDELITICQPKP